MRRSLCRHAVEAGHQLQRLPGREERVHVDFLRHDAEGGARLARVLVDVIAPDVHRAGRLVHQAGEDVDEGRLARAVGAEQAEDRAARDFEVDALQRLLGRHLLGGGIGLGQALGLDRQSRVFPGGRRASIHSRGLPGIVQGRIARIDVPGAGPIPRAA